MPPGVLPGHSRRGTRPLPTVPGTRKGLGPAGRALSAGQRQTHRHREPGHLSPVVPLRCPYPRLRHFAHAHRAGRPGSGRTLRKGRIRPLLTGGIRPGSGTVHSGGACAISGPFRRRRVRAPGNGRDGRPAPGITAPGKTLRQRPDGTGLPCAPPQDEPPFPSLRQLPDARLTFQGGHAGASAQGRFHRSGLRHGGTARRPANGAGQRTDGGSRAGGPSPGAAGTTAGDTGPAPCPGQPDMTKKGKDAVCAPSPAKMGSGHGRAVTHGFPRPGRCSSAAWRWSWGPRRRARA